MPSEVQTYTGIGDLQQEYYADKKVADYEQGTSASDVTVADMANFGGNYSMKGINPIDIVEGRNFIGIFGMPYQFMAVTDGRHDDSLDNYQIGREFGMRIVRNMPILFISPGKPKFMSKFKEEDRKGIASKLLEAALGGLQGAVDSVIGDDTTGRYYTFEYDVTEYYYHVNPMCRIAAGYMGLGNVKPPFGDKDFDRFDWQKVTIKSLTKIMGGLTDVSKYTSIMYYIESDTQVSESFNNDAVDSSLAGFVNGLSDTAREAGFILGSAQAAGDFQLAETDNSQAMFDQINEGIQGIAGGNKFLSNLFNGISSVASGGKLIFPKIWGGSSFSRSYDVTIKLRSPEKDKVSLYLNIIVPYLHMLGFVLPKQIDGNPNGYFSPFLVRCSYKGFFNVDMGLITSMTVSKGDTAEWSVDGIPSSMDINFTITDLYDALSMTKGGPFWKYNTLDNTSLMDYIATMCGINIFEPAIARTLKMALVNETINAASDAINLGIWSKLSDGLANTINSIWRRGSL